MLKKPHKCALWFDSVAKYIVGCQNCNELNSILTVFDHLYKDQIDSPGSFSKIRWKGVEALPI